MAKRIQTPQIASTAVMAESEKETYLQRVIKRSESAYYYSPAYLAHQAMLQGVTEFKVKLRNALSQKVLSLEKYKCIKIALAVRIRWHWPRTVPC